MNQFGKLLRKYRKQSRDIKSGEPLTQERLGELLGYTGAAVSDWERDKSQIDKDYRNVLIDLLKVLHLYGGITSCEEANALLEAGNYRSLNAEEESLVFPDGIPNEPTVTPKAPPKENQASESRPLAPEDWPILFLDKFRDFTKQWPSYRVLDALLWMGATWIGWFLTFPLLDWPYASARIQNAVALYISGTMVVPALVGALQKTKGNEVWEMRGIANAPLLRYYTYLGAYMGFNVGFLMIFAAALIGYYFQVSRLPVLLQIIAAGWPILWAHLAARETPYSQWGAYGRLAFKDGAVFLIFIPFGFFWGWFIRAYYPILFSPVWGGVLFAILVFYLAWLTRRRK